MGRIKELFASRQHLGVGTKRTGSKLTLALAESLANSWPTDMQADRGCCGLQLLSGSISQL
jgi:hypothetical protein